MSVPELQLVDGAAPRPAPQAAAEVLVTFLFTDIAQSTRLWEEQPEAMRRALKRHDATLRQTIEANRGQVFKTVGDSFCAAFETPADALAAALDAQLALHRDTADGASGIDGRERENGSAALSAPMALLPLKVRMALHTGVADRRDGDYFGPTLNRVARLLEVCHPQQLLLSAATRELIQDALPPGTGLADLGLHRLRDLHRAERVFQLLHPDLPAEFLPLPSLATLPNNLPEQVTRFIGREREIAAVKELLERARLVTVTGPGGTGKTRLSLQVAADLLRGEGDGVWLVELAWLSDPALVAQAVAAELGIREASAAELPGEPASRGGTGARLEPRTVRQLLVEQLRTRQLLLILDNCEHLVAACAELADALLRGCPGVRILATSREPLNIAGETTYRLPTLSVPALDELPGGRAEPTDLLEYEGVRLFVDRAVAALPSFTVSGENVVAVAEACSRLDGIPLAIELAAARVRSLPVEKINERLDDRFRLLTGGNRTAPPRQQTLRALIDWSYDLLTGPERTLLRRLSVFSGGWTLEAAEEVTGDRCRVTGSEPPDTRHPSPVTREEVLDLLTSLVEKSLVQYEEQGAEERYRLLETVRHYGRERLQEAGETEALLRRHAEWYLALAESAEPALHGPDLFEWLARLDAEVDNLRAALEWAAESSPELGLRLAGALWSYWAIRGRMSEGRERLARALEQGKATGPSLSRARALAGASGLATLQAAPGGTRAMCEESLATARAVGSGRHVALSQLFLGYHHLFGDDPAQSAKCAAESVAAARAVGEKWLIACCLDFAGAVALQEGELERAEELLEESLAIFRAIENRWLIAFTLIHLGFLAASRGDPERAARFGQESLALQARLGDRWGMALSLKLLAEAAVGQREPGRATRLLAAVEALFEGLNASRSDKGRADHERAIAAARAALGEAGFAAAWAEGRAMTLSQLLVYAAAA